MLQQQHVSALTRALHQLSGVQPCLLASMVGLSQHTHAHSLPSQHTHAHSRSFASEASPSSTSAENNATPQPPNYKVKRGSPLYQESMHRRRVWRREMHAVMQQWHAELAPRRVELHKASRAAAPQNLQNQLQGPGVPSQAQQALHQLAEEMRLAQLDEEVAQIRLQKATRAQLQAQEKEMLAERRREALLEASRHWISQETLMDSINHALDNPQPFGFTSITTRL